MSTASPHTGRRCTASLGGEQQKTAAPLGGASVRQRQCAAVRRLLRQTAAERRGGRCAALERSGWTRSRWITEEKLYFPLPLNGVRVSEEGGAAPRREASTSRHVRPPGPLTWSAEEHRMADRDGKSDLALAPGQVYIEVEYDYEYKAKDRLVTIRQGECYMLVRKTNEDWWQVRRDEGAKAFYVPAQYVRELRKALMPPPKPLTAGGRLRPNVLEIHRSNENLNRPQEMSSFGRSASGPRDANQNLSSPGHFLNNNNHHHGGSTPDSPTLRVPDHSRHPLDPDRGRTPPFCDLAGEASEKFRHDSESGDDLSSSSAEQVQTASPMGPGRPESPVYTNLEELKMSQSSLPPQPTNSPLHTAGEWETHQDASGRHFYYNRATQERSWKPPRSGRGEAVGAGDVEPLSSEENCHSTRSSQSDSQCGSPPSGWSEELDEHGQTLYVCEYTNEKWIKHVDEQGRPYYYSADGSRSEWELPKYGVPPLQPGDSAKSRSLDRKQPDPIVLTKWRHSTCVLDLNSKESATGPKQGSPDSDSYPSSPRHPSAVNASSLPHSSSSSPTSPHLLDPLTGQASSSGVSRSSHHFCLSSGCFSGLPLGHCEDRRCGCRLPSYHLSGSIPELLLSLLSNWKHSAKPHRAVSFGQPGPLLAAAKFGGNQSKPEFTVDLRGGSVEWASKDKSSKKHVIELKTRKGTDLLIQSEIDSVINDWYKALVETVNTHAWESDEAIEEDMPESPGTEKQEKEKEQRDSKKNRTMKTSISIDCDQKKTRLKLKKFLTRRPTLQAVRDKGYIKDQVFGCSLTSLCQREATTVPNFVRMCIEHVEKTGKLLTGRRTRCLKVQGCKNELNSCPSGLGVDGLYRVSGNLAVIQKLRFAVNHDEKVNLEDSKWEDIHVTTGALKMFFRELPEPLFTYGRFGDFVNAIKCSDYKQRVQLITDLLKQLPRPNQDTLQALFMHLRKVVEYGELNRMTTQSMAIVFGPTLLRPETETANIAVHMVYQNQIVELILLEYDSIFGR
ncbi:rho GTPase-activating protein 12 [Arapaima gigas]